MTLYRQQAGDLPINIVSRNKFEDAADKRRRRDLTLPAQNIYNCYLEICVCNLEMDKQMLDNLARLDPNPKVYVSWNFLGIEDRTETMPASKAQFSTNVSYSGPVSSVMVDYIKKSEIPFTLMLEKNNGEAVKVAEGKLDLTPSMKMPGRGFLRCIALSGSQGNATVYSTFKMHDCLQDAGRVPDPEDLEVGIGRLMLKKFISPPVHYYIDYSLLGFCGPELETDGLPMSQHMPFDYRRTIRVNEDNIKHLLPLLRSNDPKPLRFNILSEPCSLLSQKEVEEVGYADIFLTDLVKKNKDIKSAHIPVFSKQGENLGSLSVTILGHNIAKKWVNKEKAGN